MKFEFTVTLSLELFVNESGILKLPL